MSAREPASFELAVALRDRLQLHRAGIAPISEIEVARLIRLADRLVDQVCEIEAGIEALSQQIEAENAVLAGRQARERTIAARTMRCLQEVSCELAAGNADQRHRQMALRLRALASGLGAIAGPEEPDAVPIAGRVG